MGDKIRIDQKKYDDADDYEPTDSEAEYSEDDKELLRQVRKGRKHEVDSKENELMAFDESDDEDDDDDVGALMRNSDIEGAESDDDLPDTTDWGDKSRNYYNTDFVDPDYGTYTAEQEEMAKEEEEEAKKIQMRLAKQMKEEDFLLDDTLISAVKPKPKNLKVETAATEPIEVKADLAGITKRDKLRLFQEDSPEFAPLVDDFEKYVKEVEQIIAPVMLYVRQNNVPKIPALQFAELYQNIALSYCSNVTFYLLLKAKRNAVRNHPVTKRLLQLKKLIKQLQDKYDNIIRPQLEALLERIVDGDKFQVLDVRDIADRTKSKKKTKLGILEKYDEKSKVDEQSEDKDDEDNEDMDLTEADPYADEDTRRGITYQIAKNKGLTPARKKELRNPRVKHRNKFRKALVRRKGAVRTVRKETTRYGGEISGIKATVSKSVKFKV
ncbi:PREDICTED: something about silencing protein 10 [Bactrocera latifrons]|uniref:something about silencing protein 10 n=1 Tax=Bactrocera latifrons TaxID=174628 RepID=UPI0008DD9059|nr:PREDICTED: something about silencing protein 10 [Bactrocera latifrons]